MSHRNIAASCLNMRADLVYHPVCSIEPFSINRTYTHIFAYSQHFGSTDRVPHHSPLCRLKIPINTGKQSSEYSPNVSSFSCRSFLGIPVKTLSLFQQKQDKASTAKTTLCLPITFLCLLGRRKEFVLLFCRQNIFINFSPTDPKCHQPGKEKPPGQKAADYLNGMIFDAQQIEQGICLTVECQHGSERNR